MPKNKTAADFKQEPGQFTLLSGKRVRSQSARNDRQSDAGESHQNGFAQLEDKPTELFQRVSSTSGSVTSSLRHNSNATVTTLNKEEEEDLIRELRMHSRNQLRIDPLKELEEALMDRTTAQMSLKGQTGVAMLVVPKQKVNSSNFDKLAMPTVQTFKRLSSKQIEASPATQSESAVQPSKICPTTRKRQIKALEKQSRSLHTKGASSAASDDSNNSPGSPVTRCVGADQTTDASLIARSAESNQIKSVRPDKAQPNTTSNEFVSTTIRTTTQIIDRVRQAQGRQRQLGSKPLWENRAFQFCL
jgi:hypothetical protein